MKKILICLLIIVLSINICACGKIEVNEANKPDEVNELKYSYMYIQPDGKIISGDAKWVSWSNGVITITLIDDTRIWVHSNNCIISYKK